LIKILQATQAAYGGIDLYIRMVFKHSKNPGIVYEVACPGSYGTLKDTAGKFDVQWWNIDFVREVSLVKDLKSCIQFVRLLRSLKPDVVHLHSSKAGVLGRIACFITKTPCIYTPHAYAYLAERGKKRQIFLLIEKLFGLLPTLTLATSNSEAKRAIEDLRLKASTVKTFTNSIELSDIDRFQNLNNSEHPFLLMVGRITYQKNPEMFVRVADIIKKKWPSANFLIVGAGLHDDSYQMVNEEVRKRGLSDCLKIQGWKTKDEILDYMRSADVVVVPSRFESFGYVAAEAGACETPVVATNVDGLRDIIADGQTGYLVNIDDDLKMADKISELLENPELRKNMGMAARERVGEMFDISKNIGQLEGIYLSHAK